MQQACLASLGVSKSCKWVMNVVDFFLLALAGCLVLLFVILLFNIYVCLARYDMVINKQTYMCPHVMGFNQADNIIDIDRVEWPLSLFRYQKVRGVVLMQGLNHKIRINPLVWRYHECATLALISAVMSCVGLTEQIRLTNKFSSLFSFQVRC